MCEKAKEGMPRRVKFFQFANSSGYSSMNKVSKKQEPFGGPRRRKQVMFSKILVVSKKLWILNPKYVQEDPKYKRLKVLPAHSHSVQRGILCVFQI